MIVSNFKVRRVSGFSLVELLVGLAISLLVGLVAMGYLVSSARTLTYQNNNDFIQENSRFAFELLSSEARLVGLNNTLDANLLNYSTDILVEGISASDICKSDSTLPAQSTAVASDTICNKDGMTYTLSGNSVNSDRLAFVYANDSGVTCTGQVITTFSRVISVYWVVDNDADGIPSLYCQAYIANLALDGSSYNPYQTAGNAAPIVDGIESMQVLFGVDTNADAAVDSFSTYESLSAANRNNIVSAKIGFLISSGEAISSEQSSEGVATKTYNVLGQSISKTDGIARNTVSTTIHFPNLPIAAF